MNTENHPLKLALYKKAKVLEIQAVYQTKNLQEEFPHQLDSDHIKISLNALPAKIQEIVQEAHNKILPLLTDGLEKISFDFAMKVF